MNGSDFATIDFDSALPNPDPPPQPANTATNIHTQFQLWNNIISSIGHFPSNPTDHLEWRDPIALPSSAIQSALQFAPHSILILTIHYVRDIKQTLKTLRKKRKAARLNNDTDPIPHEHALLHSGLQYSAAWRWISAIPESLKEAADKEAELWDRYESKGTKADADAVLMTQVLGEVVECERIRSSLMAQPVDESFEESSSEDSGPATPPPSKSRPPPNGRRRARGSAVRVVGEGGAGGGAGGQERGQREVDMLGGGRLGG
ncbi:hypothetical protein LTS18_002992 [Coniosporium uncinatum]|uniref:Uncharacterized protein n=1 Tax=Coniosporium uncinatum TaxID=93489 RepID=A0ACC3DY34_9PEZI|nr:hypothetical protein LTS18_002992 [Coniosporium uncinatum]